MVPTLHGQRGGGEESQDEEAEQTDKPTHCTRPRIEIVPHGSVVSVRFQRCLPTDADVTSAPEPDATEPTSWHQTLKHTHPPATQQQQQQQQQQQLASGRSTAAASPTLTADIISLLLLPSFLPSLLTYLLLTFSKRPLQRRLHS